MVKRHLSRLTSPKSWPIKRKGIKWIIRPRPGPHALKNSIPITLVLKRLLKYAKTTNEVKKILNDGKILVDKVVKKDHRLPLGVMDVLECPSIKEYFRIVYTPKGKFTVVKINAEEAKIKPAKIIGKTMLKGKKVQLNLYDGKNIQVEKDEFKVDDTVILSMAEKGKPEIKKHLKFDKGAMVYIVEGNYKGMSGTVEEIKPIFRNPTIKVKSKDKTFETSKHFAFVVDQTISVGEHSK